MACCVGGGGARACITLGMRYLEFGSSLALYVVGIILLTEVAIEQCYSNWRRAHKLRQPPDDHHTLLRLLCSHFAQYSSYYINIYWLVDTVHAVHIYSPMKAY